MIVPRGASSTESNTIYSYGFTKLEKNYTMAYDVPPRGFLISIWKASYGNFYTIEYIINKKNSVYSTVLTSPVESDLYHHNLHL